MAKFSGMTPIEATSKLVEEKYNEEQKRITFEQYEYYKEIRAWEKPIGTYERDMWELFKESIEYRMYIA